MAWHFRVVLAVAATLGTISVVSCGRTDRGYGQGAGSTANSGSGGDDSDSGAGGDFAGSAGEAPTGSGGSGNGPCEGGAPCCDDGEPCEFGCADGVCKPDPCAEVSCDEASACQLSPGTCDSTTGECIYEAESDHEACGTSLECIAGECECTATSCADGCCSATGCGACEPKTLTTRSVEVQALTVSSPLVFFLEGAESGVDAPMVYSLSTSGGDPQELTVPPPDDSTFNTIVTDGSYIYGGPFNYNKVRRMPITGGVFAEITDGDAYGATRLRTNSTNVFAGFGLSSAGIKTFAKTGGGAVTLIDSLTIDSTHYAVDEDYLYFLSSNRTVISRVAVSGGDPSTVAAAAASEEFVDLAVSGDNLLFVSTTRVGRVERTGGTPETIEEGAAYALVTDSDRVYYLRAKGQSADCASGSDLLSAPIAGGPSRRVASEATESCARSLDQDSSALYWIAGTSIKSMSKQ